MKLEVNATQESMTEFWKYSKETLLEKLHASASGLSYDQALKRQVHTSDRFQKFRLKLRFVHLFIRQFTNPLVALLLCAALSLVVYHEYTDATIIFTIIFFSGILGFWQEKNAVKLLEKLTSLTELGTLVIRDGKEIEIPMRSAVPGDIVLVRTGDLMPGDGVIIESKDLFVDESRLTGESFPVEKREDQGGGVGEARRLHAVFMGSHVISGTAKVLLVLVGKDTEYSQMIGDSMHKLRVTDFELEMRTFGYFMLQVTFFLILMIFALNIALLHRPVIEAFLFALALAVGFTPELLPAIISINLAQGARRMVEHKVLVKRLAAIQNFGSMDILCSDKTGTLTEGVFQFHSAVDIHGKDYEKIKLYAFLNAIFETGFINPIDTVIKKIFSFDVTSWQKHDEIPYDFIRKRMSICAFRGQEHVLITKGAVQSILEICTQAEDSQGISVPIQQVNKELHKEYEKLSSQGFRVIAIAYKSFPKGVALEACHECDMTFLGFLVFFDPPKLGAKEMIQKMKDKGISLKIISGDNKFVAAHIAMQIGLQNTKVLTGKEIAEMSESALMKNVISCDLFAELVPNQKERLIHALKKQGHTVGYLGDGINDASALYASDISIAVDSAVDVLKEASDIILLEKNLGILLQGVLCGRVAFANSLKYILMATSANFGNMFSMACSSLLLNFLPLLPKQILLTNLTTDLPEMAIATDNVDEELISKPCKWNIDLIRRFMVIFGLISSFFDFVTFGMLLYLFDGSLERFRTGWFIESVLSATLIVLVIRTSRPFFRSLPGRHLLYATFLTWSIVFALTTTQLGSSFEFCSMPLSFYVFLALLLCCYVTTTEFAKKVFYKYVWSNTKNGQKRENMNAIGSSFAHVH